MSEDIGFRGGIGLEGAMTVEVVRHDVEDRRDMGAPVHLTEPFKLEGREFEYHPHVRGDMGERVEERPTDVSADLVGEAGRRQRRADHGHRGGLPVGAGHPADRGRAAFDEKPDLGGYTNPRAARGRQQGRFPRNRRARHHHVSAGEIGLVVTAQNEPYAETVKRRHRLREIVSGLEIGEPSPARRARRGPRRADAAAETPKPLDRHPHAAQIVNRHRRPRKTVPENLVKKW